jgi:hypothetical protein
MPPSPVGVQPSDGESDTDDSTDEENDDLFCDEARTYFDDPGNAEYHEADCNGLSGYPLLAYT